MRGVPLRIELGPKDVAKNSVVLARRDRPGREGKSFVPQAGIAAVVTQTLAEIQQALYDRALAFRKANTFDPKDSVEFKQAVEKGFAFSFWCGSSDCEAKIKEETKATMRCIPLEQPGGSGRVFIAERPLTNGPTSPRRTEILSPGQTLADAEKQGAAEAGPYMTWALRSRVRDLGVNLTETCQVRACRQGDARVLAFKLPFPALSKCVAIRSSEDSYVPPARTRIEPISSVVDACLCWHLHFSGHQNHTCAGE